MEVHEVSMMVKRKCKDGEIRIPYIRKDKDIFGMIIWNIFIINFNKL